MNVKTVFQGLLGNHQNFLVAYSGGVDSHVLLHALVAEAQSIAPQISVIHVNHQLNPNADQWSTHCQKICDALQVPLCIEKIKIDFNPGDSLEEKAREARYAALKKHMTEDTVLLTAHNLNDQAETFLLQVLRGAGPKGLSAMPIKKKFGAGYLVRPFLTISREEIEHYACEHGLQWIEDNSNADQKFNRNFLRHEILPLLQKRFPKYRENFSRSARLMAEQESVIVDIAKQDLAICRRDECLDIKKLLLLSESRQRLVLREWFHENNLRMPSLKHLKQIQKDVLMAAPDAHPVFQLPSVILSREKNFLELISKNPLR